MPVDWRFWINMIYLVLCKLSINAISFYPVKDCTLLLQPWTSMFLKFVNEFCTFSARFAAITAAISFNFGTEVFVFDRRDLLDMKPCSLYELYLITAYASALVPIMLSSPNKRISISRSFSLILVIGLNETW